MESIEEAQQLYQHQPPRPLRKPELTTTEGHMTLEQMQEKAAQLYDEAAYTSDPTKAASLKAEADALMDMVDEGEEMQEFDDMLDDFDDLDDDSSGAFYERDFDHGDDDDLMW